MEVNKVEYFGKVLLDLTEDSVTPDKMSVGVTAHDASGQKIVGTATLDGYTRTVLYEGLMYSLGTYTIGSIIGYDEIEILYANQIGSASNTEQFSTLRMMAKDMLNLTSPVSEDVILLTGSYVSSGMRRLMFRMIDDKTLKITTNNNIAITKITGIKYDYGGVPTQWFTGTEVTGTGGPISAVVLGSKAGDMYLNTDTSYVYKASAENEWYYVCDIKGKKADSDELKMLGWTSPDQFIAKNYVDDNRVFHQLIQRVDLGSLEWKKLSTNVFYATPSSIKIITSGSLDIYCSDYPTVAYKTSNSEISSVDNKTLVYKYNTPSGNVINIKDTSYNDVTEFTKAVSGKYLYYETSSPKTVKVDGNEDSEIIKQSIEEKIDKSGGVVTGNLTGPTATGETNPKWVISKEGNALFSILAYFSGYVVNLIDGYSKLKDLVVETINGMNVPEKLDFVDNNFVKNANSRVVGEWIDGSDLYESVATFISPGPNDYDNIQELRIGNTVTSVYERYVDLSYMDIKQLISIEGILNNGNVNVPIATLYQDTQNLNWWFSANTGRLTFRSTGYSGYTVNLIIKYLNKES